MSFGRNSYVNDTRELKSIRQGSLRKQHKLLGRAQGEIGANVSDTSSVKPEE
ncbi:hypothetical protein M404DRAFT_998962 [Pisolithus tinctorius Marx 270]|uniref:Uncharacterized protein n=1 Tax=Pisolithus tinctorius Marx 270 TaxID=870435 RepID=A0A0C3NZT2_PISTI|nr:hypothetical protein M404DRAFT_998962 [Pisolithus tinctorius Marx 270]